MILDSTIARCAGSQCSRKLECVRHIALLDGSYGEHTSVGDNYCSSDVGHGKVAWHWSYIILESEHV